MSFTIDFEVTNRCNADCYFCPRDQTPHEGLMSPEVFRKGLERAQEYRVAVENVDGSDITVSLCGLGEPFINKRVAEWVGSVKAAGFRCAMSSNGGLLDERRGRAVLDAGLDQIMINVGEMGADYEEIYKLPWQRTHDNIVRFVEMAGEDCSVVVVLVDHRQDPEHIASMRAFWRERGVQSFVDYEIMNRGGALFVDHMQYQTMSEHSDARALLDRAGGRPLCGAPFAYMFIGYDGNYYLCCSDWKKEVPLGTVFDSSLLDVIRPKLEMTSRRASICRTCNLDPLNQLTDQLRGENGNGPETDFEERAVQTISVSREIERVLESIVPGVSVDLPVEDRQSRKLIPVTGS